MLARNLPGLSCALVLLSTLLGCDTRESAGDAMGAGDRDAGIGAAGSYGDGAEGDRNHGHANELSNDQIAGVMIAANAGELVQGRLAMTSATDASVRAFGTRMYMEHRSANDALGELIETTSLEWGTSRLSDRVSKSAQHSMDQLTALSGSAFDREYVTVQHAAFTRLLAILDDELLPAVTNPLLESELVAMRAATTDHLVEAGGLRDAQADAGTNEP